MPINYKNGKIYEIVCRITGEKYVGSTTQQLSKRLTEHRKLGNNTMSKHIIERGDYYINLLEECPCENKGQLLQKERHYYDSIEGGCINKLRPWVSKEETSERQKAYNEKNKEQINAYRETIKEQIKENNKTLYERNKEHILANVKAYRAKNKKQILANKKAYYEKNREQILSGQKASGKAYYEKNKEQILARRKAYKNKEQIEDKICELI